MRVALTADWQFDEYAGRSDLTPEGITTRLAAAIQCFRWVCDEAVKRKCKRLYMLGDIFDSRTSIPLSVLNRVCEAVEDESSRLEIVMCVGNHDTALRTPGIHSLSVFLGSAIVLDRPDISVDSPFAVFPWYDDPEDIKEAVEKLVQKTTKQRYYLLGHCTVKGSIPGGGGIPAEYLRPDHFKYVFLGDVHEPLLVADTILSIGAPMQHNWGDAGKMRGFVVLDTDRDSVDYVENTISPRYQRITEAVKPSADVKPTDYVKIDIADADEAAKVVDQYRAVTPNVQSMAVESIGEKPRLDINASASVRDAMERYIRYIRPDASDETVAKLLAAGVTLIGAGE